LKKYARVQDVLNVQPVIPFRIREAIKYFVNYNMDRGWYIASQPIITADWRANAVNRWMVPFGGLSAESPSLGSSPLTRNSQRITTLSACETCRMGSGK
jgi:hypothetical protein